MSGRVIGITGLALLLLGWVGCGGAGERPAGDPAVGRLPGTRVAATTGTATTSRKLPQVTFAGVTTTGERVVFCCESSGSMFNKFGELRKGLMRAIDGLTPAQSFEIVFLREEERYLPFAERLVAATDEHKRMSYAFLDKTSPHGSTEPIPALRAAFAVEPDVIFLLTDGDFSDNEGVRREIRTLNRGNHVRVQLLMIFTAPTTARFTRRCCRKSRGRTAGRIGS